MSFNKKSHKAVSYKYDFYSRSDKNYDLENIYTLCGLLNNSIPVLYIDNYRPNTLLDIRILKVRTIKNRRPK